MEWPQPSVGINEVQKMISGYNGTNPTLDPIRCLQQAEGVGWKLDSCRFLLSHSLAGNLDTRERSYLLECAAITLASVFDVLLHEIVHYYGLAIPPKRVRWNERFVDRLKAVDGSLAESLGVVRESQWFRRAAGLRHYVTHHSGLLQLIAVHISEGERSEHREQTYSLTGDEYFEQDDGVDSPSSFKEGYLDREALHRELLDYLGRMCRVVDQVRLHCFEAAPAFESGRRRKAAIRREVSGK